MEKTLRERFPGTKFQLTALWIVLLLAGFSVHGQSLTVAGEVTADGSPLPGVSIFEKGTNNGTTTDAQGKFTLHVASPSALLTFSFIGYRTVVRPVDNQTVINIIMEEDVTSLSEIVVTA